MDHYGGQWFFFVLVKVKRFYRLLQLEGGEKSAYVFPGRKYARFSHVPYVELFDQRPHIPLLNAGVFVTQHLVFCGGIEKISPHFRQVISTVSFRGHQRFHLPEMSHAQFAFRKQRLQFLGRFPVAIHDVEGVLLFSLRVDTAQ